MKDFFKKTLLNCNWWLPALKRAGWTVAQVAIATIGTTAVISEVNWILVLDSCALAGILSLLKSAVVGMPETECDQE